MTASEIKYLLAISHLSIAGRVRQSDIADYLGFSRPSVARAMDNLAFLGYITKDGEIILTQKGYEESQKLSKAKKYLQDTILAHLGNSNKAAQRDAVEIMGVLSNCNLEKLYELSLKDE